MFWKLLSEWTAMPKVLDQGIEKGFAGREPQAGWVPLKGLSAISDVLPPEAYAYPGYAQVYNKAIMKFRRRAAFSAPGRGSANPNWKHDSKPMQC
jgi:hypothetical protein